MLRLLDRDKKVIEFLDNYRIATTNQLQDMFYPSLRVAQRRLKKLFEEKLIFRERDKTTNEFIYFTQKKNKHSTHDLFITDFIIKLLKNNVEIKKIAFESVIDKIQVDAKIGIEYKGRKKLLFVESENTKRFDHDKYLAFYKNKRYKDFIPVFPTIVAIDDKTIKEGLPFHVIHLKTNLSNFDNFMEALK